LSRAVVEQGADLGIAFDGDGDRVMMVDAAGNEVDGDQLLYIMTLDLYERGVLEGGVAGTLMTNLGLELALRERDIPFVRAKVGGGMNKCPQKLINVRYQSNGGSPLDAPELREAVAATEARLADTGRVLLRLSGTEPVIRVMVEGQNAAQVNQEAEALAAVVRKMFAAD